MCEQPGKADGPAARVCGVMLVARPKLGECGTGKMCDENGFAKCGRGRKGGHIEGHGELSIWAGTGQMRWPNEWP
jgi:hypothetical protein